MDQNNNYFDLDSYQRNEDLTKRQKKKDRGSFFAGLAIGVMATLLVTTTIALILWFTGNLKTTTPSGMAYVSEDEEPTQSVKGSGFVTDEMVKKINKLVNTIKKEYFLEEVTDEQYEAARDQINEKLRERGLPV